MTSHSSQIDWRSRNEGGHRHTTSLDTSEKKRRQLLVSATSERWDGLTDNKGGKKMKLSKLVIVLLSIYIFSAPASAFGFQSKNEKYRIVETVLRIYMNNYSSAKGYKLYYIGVEIDGKDVTKEFLKRFEGNIPRVREFEQNKYDPERLKKEDGIVLGIRGIKRLSKSRVKVYGLTIDGRGEGLNWIHELKRRGRKWTVIDEANLNLS